MPFDYQKDSEVWHVRVVVWFRHTGREYDRGAALRSPIIDKERFFSDFIRFCDQYLTRQESEIVASVEGNR